MCVYVYVHTRLYFSHTINTICFTSSPDFGAISKCSRILPIGYVHTKMYVLELTGSNKRQKGIVCVVECVLECTWGIWNGKYSKVNIFWK